MQSHLRGNAECASLRLSLGCLLAPQFGLVLWRVGSGTGLTLAADEPRLSGWLETNARAAWIEHDKPWKCEYSPIRALSLRLSLDQNDSHPFFIKLSALWADARALPVLNG
jgi:hypothetical protein